MKQFLIFPFLLFFIPLILGQTKDNLAPRSPKFATLLDIGGTQSFVRFTKSEMTDNFFEEPYSRMEWRFWHTTLSR